jgi:ATP-dependent Zn protease
LAVFGGIILLMLFKDRMDVPGEFINQYTFEQLVDSNLIEHATIHYSSQNTALNEITGIYYRTGENGARLEIPFRAKVRLTGALEGALLGRPEFEPHEPNSLFMNIVVSVLPILIIAALIWFFFIRQIRKAARAAPSAVDTHARTIQQQERFDKVLAKWEEQGRRMDTVLEKMEKDYGLK